MAKKKLPHKTPVTTIRLKDIQTPGFNEAFSRLMTIRNIPAPSRHKVVRLAKVINDEQTQLRDLQKETILKYCEIREDGTPKIDEDGRDVIWKSDEDKKAYQDEWDKVLEGSFDLIIARLKPRDLDKVDMSPADLLNLDALFVDE